jgi:hypothetical protein
MHDELGDVRELVSRFEAADAELAECVSRRDVAGIAEAIKKAVDTKRLVKRWLTESERLPKMDQALAGKLRRIRGNQGYTIDQFREWDTSNDLDWVLPYPDFVMQLWASFEFADGPEGNPIIRRAGAIGTLIPSQGVPDHLARHLATVKRCFAVGLYDAVPVFCRSLTEAAVYHFLDERHDLPGGPKPGSFDLLKRVSPYLSRQALDKAHKIRKLANDLVHGKKKVAGISESEASRAIRDTFEFIERLFE